MAASRMSKAIIYAKKGIHPMIARMAKGISSMKKKYDAAFTAGEQRRPNVMKLKAMMKDGYRP